MGTDSVDHRNVEQQTLALGKEALMELARRDGLYLGGKLTDCGTLVFDNTRQDVHSVVEEICEKYPLY